jgi:prolyl oligopeptidase
VRYLSGLCSVLGAVLGLVTATVAVAAAPVTTPAYPPAPRGNHVDDYHGVKVADAYRWMEDIDSPQTRAWVKAESELSARYLAAIPDRDAIAHRLQQIWNFERWSPPERHGKYWFYSHNDGLQNQSVIFVTTDPAGPGHVLLDPNLLSKDGTVALRERAVSDDGRYFAYALSDAGSDWQIWHVRDVATGKDLPDEIHWSKAGGGTWRKDDSGFYYTAYDAPTAAEALKASNQYEKLYFHRLGTTQAQDTLVYTRTDDPDWFVAGAVTDDGHYLIIQANHGDEVQNTVLVQDLSVPGAPIVPVIPKPTALYNVIGNIGARLYVQTDDGAPRYRIVAIDLAKPAPANWHTIVPEQRDTLDAVTLVGGQLIASYLEDAHSAVRRFSPEGKALGEIQLAGLGTASGFQGRLEDSATYYTYDTFTTPPSVYRLDLHGGGGSTLWRQPHLQGFTASDYQTQQVFYESKDGTRVPMFIVSHDPVRLRRVQHLRTAGLLTFGGRLAGAGRRVRARQHPRGRRVRSRLARSGHEDPQAERIR